MVVGECGPPVAAEGVVIHYTTTFKGSSITFACEDGIFPNVNITATCTGGHWSPDPATYICIGKILSLTLQLSIMITVATHLCYANEVSMIMSHKEPV